MKIALLLGSGVSFPSKLPNVDNITDSLLREDWHSHTNQNYYKDKDITNNSAGCNWVERIQPFLQIIVDMNSKYILKRRKTKVNYEDLYYFVLQISRELDGYQDNSLIRDRVVKIRLECNRQGLFSKFDNQYCNLKILCDRAIVFIQCVVWNSLYRVGRPYGMELISEFGKSQDVKRLDIFTVNHDMLVENLFKEDKIPYFDGFGAKDGDVTKFQPKLYSRRNPKIRIVKLHGSVDWYMFEGKSGAFYGRATNPDINHCRDESRRLIRNMTGRPVFLTGTENKINNYAFGIYFDLQYWFRKILYQHSTIVSSGYGWNDEGINQLIYNWLSIKNNRLILLHRDPDKIQLESKFGIYYRFGRMKDYRKIICLSKWLSEVSIDEIIAEINSRRSFKQPTYKNTPAKEFLDFATKRQK